MSPASDDRRAALLRADRGTGAGGDAAGGGRVRAPARARRRVRQAARAAARHLAGVGGRLAAGRAAGAGDVDRRRAPARGRGRARVVALAAGDPARHPAVVGRAGTRRVRADGAARRLLARRLADREADGHGVHQRRRRRPPLPARGPVDGGGGPQLLLPRAPDGGGRAAAVGGGAGRGLQPRGRDVLRALRGGGVRARLRARRADRDRAVGRGAGHPRGHDRLGPRPAPGRRAAAHLRLVRGLARDRGDDQRVPRVLVHAPGPPRARDGDPVHVPGARVRAPARDRRAGPAAARAGDRRARRRGDRGRDAVRDQRLVVPRRRRPVRARRAGAHARGADPARARAHAGVDARRAAARRARGAAVPAQLRRGRRRARHGLRARVVLELGQGPRGAVRAVRLPRVLRLPRAAHPLEPSVADGGLGGGGRAVRRLAAGGQEPDRRRRAGGARVRGRALGVRQPRPRDRALRVGAARRRAAVPADPGAGLRPRLLRRRRPLPHEHGVQARLPGVAAAGGGQRAGDRVELGLVRAPRDGCAARVGGAAARPRRARRRLPGGGDLRAQERLRRLAAPRRPALADGVRTRRPRGDRVAERQRAARLGRARGGRRRLLRLRPRADLDLHRPPDGHGLGRPRAPVGPRPRHAARRTWSRSTAPPTRRARASCSTATTSATSWSGRSSAPTYGDAGVAKFDQLGRRVFDRDGTIVWELR